MSAKTGRLEFYALTRGTPLIAEVPWENVELVLSASMEEYEIAQIDYGTAIDNCIEAFFAQENVDKEDSILFTKAFNILIPEELRLFYQAIAPDFYDWLK